MKSEAGEHEEATNTVNLRDSRRGAAVMRFRARRNIIFSETSDATPTEGVAADDGGGHVVV